MSECLTKGVFNKKVDIVNSYEFLICDLEHLSEFNQHPNCISIVLYRCEEQLFSIMEQYDEFPFDHIIDASTKDFQDDIAFIFDVYKSQTNKNFLSNEVVFEQLIDKWPMPIDDELYKNLPDTFYEKFKDMIKQTTDELVSNAVKHGALEDKLDRPFENFKIRLRLQDINNRLILSAEDEMGLLSNKKVIKSLLRGMKTQMVEEKESGAGLGFYLLFHWSNQLIFHFMPHQSTFCGVLFCPSKRYKKFKERSKSIHFFRLEE
jgi:hypothetical protein